MKKRTLFSRILSLALMLALALTLAPARTFASADNDTFIYAIEGDPGNDVNTISTSDRFGLMVERMVYSPLFNYYGPDDITYLLAESFTLSEDKLLLTVNLRKDVLWSDGVPFTADDVIFTYDHIMARPDANGYDGLVFDGQKIELTKVDDYTIEFRMPLVVGALLESVVAEHFIMPKHIYEGDESLDNNPKNATPVGTGPYTIAEYAPGQYVRFAANEHYFLGKAKIGTVIFQITTDPNTTLLALNKGEINAMVLANSAAEDVNSDVATVYPYPEDRVGYMGFDLASERVQDVNLRKAVMFALNRQDMNVGAYLSDEFFVNAYSFLPANALYYTEDLEKYERDLDKAKEHLALVENVPGLRLAYSSTPATDMQAMVIQQNLKEIGIALEIIPMEFNAMIQRMQDPNNSDYDMFLSGYIMGSDPSLYATLFTSGSSSNYYHLKDDEVDALFAAGAIETDNAKREEHYVKVQQRLADLAVQFPIVTNLRLLGVTNDVGGMDEARLITIYTFEDMSKLYFKED